MNEQDKEQFAEKSKALFDDSVERLDAATLSQLNQARHRALEEVAAARPRTQWLRWMPVTGVAAAAVVAVMVMNVPVAVQTGESIMTTDFELLLEDDNLEMFEDLEFYSWLEAADLDANGNVG
jgi:negative regulator of sigma E activity